MALPLLSLISLNVQRELKKTFLMACSSVLFQGKLFGFLYWLLEGNSIGCISIHDLLDQWLWLTYMTILCLSTQK